MMRAPLLFALFVLAACASDGGGRNLSPFSLSCAQAWEKAQICLMGEDKTACEQLGILPEAFGMARGASGDDDNDLLSQPASYYPNEAARRGAQAACAVRYDILPDGSTANICVECRQSGPAPCFEEFTRLAVAGRRYVPSDDVRRGETGEITYMLRKESTDFPAMPDAPVCRKPDSMAAGDGE